MKRVLAAIFVLYVIFSVQTVFGQELSDTLKYKGSFTFGGSYKTGIQNQSTVTGSFSGTLKKSNWVLGNKTSYINAIVNKTKLLDDWEAISRLSYLTDKKIKVYPTLFHFYEKLLLYRINNSNRLVLGAFTPLNDNDEDSRLFVGVGFENTNYGQEVFRNSDLIDSNRNFTMSTINFKNSHRFGDKKFSLKYNLFYIQSFKEASDYTIWIIPSISMAITKQISFAINYDFRYKNVHLIELPSVNQSLTFNLGISFKN